MPALLLLLGLAAVVAIAAATGHPKKALPAAQGSPPQAGTVELDRGMPQSVVQQVLFALTHDASSTHLEELAHGLEAKYPLSAGELRAKAALLHAAGTVQTLPAVAHAPAPLLSAAPHALAPTPAHSPADGHELQAATVLQAAMRALVEESDPVVLEGFADSIRTLYPTAATLLLDRAHSLRAPAGQTISPTGPVSTPAVVTATPGTSDASAAAAPRPNAMPPPSTESHA